MSQTEPKVYDVFQSKGDTKGNYQVMRVLWNEEEVTKMVYINSHPDDFFNTWKYVGRFVPDPQ